MRRYKGILGIFSGLTLYKIYSIRTNFSLYTKNLSHLYSEYLLPSELVTSQIKDSGCKCWAPFFPFPETLLSNRFTLVLTWKFTFTICLHWSKGWLDATVITHILKKWRAKYFAMIPRKKQEPAVNHNNHYTARTHSSSSQYHQGDSSVFQCPSCAAHNNK